MSTADINLLQLQDMSHDSSLDTVQWEKDRERQLKLMRKQANKASVL